MGKVISLITWFGNCLNLSRRGRMRCIVSLMMVVLLFTTAHAPAGNGVLENK